MQRGFLGKLTWSLVQAVMALSLMYLLFFHFEPNAPMWTFTAGTSGLQAMEIKLEKIDQNFLADAGDGNIELHFVGFDVKNDWHQNLMVCDAYYRANYTLFPHRAFIGQSDRILNGGEDIIAADRVPDDAWLIAHQVRTVQTLIQTPQGIVGDARAIH